MKSSLRWAHLALALSVLCLALSASVGQAQICDPWRCQRPGGIVDVGRLADPTLIICEGDSASPTTEGIPFRDGEKERHCCNRVASPVDEPDCFDEDEPVICCSPELLFQPDLPSTFEDVGTFNFGVQVKGASSDDVCADVPAQSLGNLTVEVQPAVGTSIDPDALTQFFAVGATVTGTVTASADGCCDGNNVSSGDQLHSQSLDSSSVGKKTVTADRQVCISTPSFNYTNPKVVFAVTSKKICKSERSFTAKLTADSGTGNQTVWSGISGGSGSGKSDTFNPSAAGKGTYTLTATAGGSSMSDSLSLLVTTWLWPNRGESDFSISPCVTKDDISGHLKGLVLTANTASGWKQNPPNSNTPRNAAQRKSRPQRNAVGGGRTRRVTGNPGSVSLPGTVDQA